MVQGADPAFDKFYIPLITQPLEGLTTPSSYLRLTYPMCMPKLTKVFVIFRLSCTPVKLFELRKEVYMKRKYICLLWFSGQCLKKSVSKIHVLYDIIIWITKLATGSLFVNCANNFVHQFTTKKSTNISIKHHPIEEAICHNLKQEFIRCDTQ